MARILVIDDENNIRLMIRLALRASGHEVEVATDGPDGLEKFGDGSTCDLVLLDQRMPGMEGLEVLRRLRRIQPAAKVIMITAFGTIDLAAEAMRAGATDFLRKPFTTEVLRSAVQNALENAPAATDGTPKSGPSISFGGASINGFRISGDASGEPDGSVEDADGTLRHRFVVQAPDGHTTSCTVVLPPFFQELVRAHVDREQVRDENFWLWLSEEALANSVWQNAEAPPGNTLLVDELTTGLRRWIDAVLTP